MTRGFANYPATSVINDPNHWSGPIEALINQAATYYTHRKLYINDSGDVLTVDKPLQLSDSLINATVHVMSGGPSMLGDDIAFLDEERLRYIKQTLPRPREVAFPVDLFAKREQRYPRVFHRKVLKPWGRFDVIAVYNLEASKFIDQEVLLKSVGLNERLPYLVWEFWGSEYLGKVRGSLTAHVAPRSVKVYRLTEDKGEPVILGTDMHVLMGEMEIDRSEWDTASKTLSGRAIRPVGERGNVFIYAPPKMGVANPAGHFLAKDGRDNSLIIRCPLQFQGGSADWSIRFFDL